MIRMGYDLQFVAWITRCIQSSSFLFNINGEVDRYIQPSRSIRQGDLLSPYVFLIYTEALTNLINNAVMRKELEGLKISKSGPKLTYLLFVDDSLLFCKADVGYIKFIKELLEYYALCSGQMVNLEKSVIFSAKIHPLS